MATATNSRSGMRGRPVEIDPSHLSRVAIELFAQRGYDAVSAAEIAEAAGISRRSLFRYFPTKADLVWDGFGDSLEVLSVALLDNGGGSPTEAVLRATLVVAERQAVHELTRARLAIIAAHPELVSFGIARLDQQVSICAAYLRNRDVDRLTAQVQASAITAAAFTGYLHWATVSTDPAPLGTIRKALAALDDL